jgi:hypothetical protein
MTIFDHDAADAARAKNPALTIFDTGQMLEPGLESESYLDTSGPINFNRTRHTGLVEFTNDENAPILVLFAQPSVTDDDTTLLNIQAPTGGRLKIVLDDTEIWVGDADNIEAGDFLAQRSAHKIAIPAEPMVTVQPTATVDWDSLVAQRVAANRAAAGDSNDTEIENLQELAESLWNELAKFSAAPEVPDLDDDADDEDVAE